MADYTEEQRYQGPHLLTARDGSQARCSGDPQSCEFCAKGRTSNIGEQVAAELFRFAVKQMDVDEVGPLAERKEG